MEKFANKYRIQTARYSKWNYGWNGVYFITICTQNHEQYFGEIADREMYLTEIGNVANQCVIDIPKHFPFVRIDNYVIMPNHVHLLIVIDKPPVETQNFASSSTKQMNVETQNLASPNKMQTNETNAETQNLASLRDEPFNEFGAQSRNIASIVRGFKIGVTKFAKSNNLQFLWQPRFYDRIVRDQNEYDLIVCYIENNVNNWGKDKFNKQ